MDEAIVSQLPRSRTFGLPLKLSHAIGILGVLVIAVGVLTSAFFAISLYDSEVNTIRNRLQIPAQANADAVRQIGELADGVLREIQAAAAKSEDWPSRPDPAMKALLLGYTHFRAAAYKLEIYDSTGAEILGSRATTHAVSVAGYEFFRRQIAARGDQVIASELVADPLDGTPAIVLSRPLFDKKGIAQGVAAVYLSAAYVQKRFDSLSLPPGSTLTLFNGAGRALVRSPAIEPGDPILSTDFSQRPNYQAFRSGDPSGSFDKFQTVDGTYRFIAGVATKDVPFVVAAGWETKAALAHWRRTATIGAAGRILAALLVGALFFYIMRDISHRQTNDVTLWRSRENLARAQRVAGVGSFERDLITGHTEWSDEFLRIWGIASDAPRATAEHLLALVHPDDRKAFLEGRDRALNNQPIPPLDFRIVRSDGAVRILHREYGIVRDAGGKPLRMFGTIQDVTARNKGETALRRSREALTRAQRLAGIGSFERDLITGEIEYSDELLHIHGVESVGPHAQLDILYPLIHPDDRERVQEFRRQATNGTIPAPIDYRIRRPDGVKRILHRTCEIQFDANQRPVRLFGTIQDITERKEIEIALRHSRENMARAQQIANLGSFDHDLTTGRVEWTDEIYRILGLAVSAVVPGPDQVLNFIHPDDRAAVTQSRANDIAARRGAVREYRIIRSDGAERIIRRESVVVCDDAGRSIRYCGTWQDVTDRRVAEERERELERQLLHSQKLEALGTLAGGIAHDLNNTLVPIMALSKLAARRAEPGSTVRNNLETIFEASERARDLVRRVLSFSRKDEAEKRDAHLGDVVREALKLMRATVPTSIQLDAVIAEVPPIQADASQLHQVITNLVSNAAGAMKDGKGTITVSVTPAARARGVSEVCLSVVDNGCGMDEATRQRIFEPFFTTKPVGDGTGLGLSIVHGIVASHGGEIEVKSAPGKGTRFDLYFPVSPVEASGAAAA